VSPAPAPGVVYAAGGGSYEVRLGHGEVVEASLRGRLKREPRTGERVVVGDRVELARLGNEWVVERVLERASQLVRRGPGGRRAKVAVANVDRVLVVVAAREPDPTPTLVDRLLAVTEASGFHPMLLVNKVDLPGGPDAAASLVGLYGTIGYPVLPTSTVTGEGMEVLTRWIRHGVSALVGPSGGGKSSILNRLHPELGLRTGALSRKTGQGRHTTVGARLVALECGGVVADTPGFGDVGVWGMRAAEVARCFPEISSREEGCRFGGCAHLREPDCAVRRAVEGGEIAGSRYRSYVALREEAAAAEARETRTSLLRKSPLPEEE
jgi:ribosome biogenesis GTPase